MVRKGWMNVSLGLLVLAGLLVAVPAATVRGQAAGGGAGQKIVTVNLVKVFNQLKEKAAGDDAIKNMEKKFQQERETKQRELENLQKERDEYKPDSKDYQETTESILKKAAELKTATEFAEQKMLMEQRLKTAEIYRHINDAVAKLAKREGYSLVLVAEDVELAARNQQELLSKITLRKVLYADPSLDITAKVIDEMNGAYAIGGAGK